MNGSKFKLFIDKLFKVVDWESNEFDNYCLEIDNVIYSLEIQESNNDYYVYRFCIVSPISMKIIEYLDKYIVVNKKDKEINECICYATVTCNGVKYIYKELKS